MQSIINHIAGSAQLALEGTLSYKRSLHSILDESTVDKRYSIATIDFEASVVYNTITFKLIVTFPNAKDTTEIATDAIYSYNAFDMAEASVKFLLCQLLYKAMHSDTLSVTHIKELQNTFKEAFGIAVSII